MASALRKQGDLGDAQDYCSVRNSSNNLCVSNNCNEAILILCYRKPYDYQLYQEIKQRTHVL